MEQRNLKLLMVEANMVLGDLEANAAALRRYYQSALAQKADLLVLPELFLCGYPIEDLRYDSAFMDAHRAMLEKLASETIDACAILLGALHQGQDGRVYNSAYLLQDGKIAARRDKVNLPNYGVFDEKRIFTIGDLQGPILFKDFRIGIAICEDIWEEDLCEALAESGAQLIIALNGSPFEIDKISHRHQIVTKRVLETGLPFIYLNRVGGQDELVFDGASFAMVLEDDLVSLKWQAPSFIAHNQALLNIYEADDGQAVLAQASIIEPPALYESLYQAMVMGLKDYVNNNHFQGVLLGLSGGIDSAICAAIAVDALGKERVRAIYMPSPYSSKESDEDAALCAKMLDIQYDIMPIDQAMQAVDHMLHPVLPDGTTGLAAENMQSRLRGLALMSLSNQTGWMVLTTGNKSENAVGYATLYGDMCGGYNPIKDLYKQDLFAVAAWRNNNDQNDNGQIMPDRILTKAPSAELRADQKDSDSLPEYPILDAVLYGLIEKRQSPSALYSQYGQEIVDKIYGLLRKSEYKRQQAALGVKLSSLAFGRDWRFPISNGFHLD